MSTVLTKPLSLSFLVIPPAVLASSDKFGTSTWLIILLISSGDVMLVPMLLKLIVFIGDVGLYLSFCSFTWILNLTVVVLTGFVLSAAVIITIFSSVVAFLSIFPDNLCNNGVLSVAASLDASPLSTIPLGNPVVIKLLILPVLSDAFTVISAFSPRYTATFSRLSSFVSSVNIVSWPLVLTNLTVGFTFSSTLNQPTTVSSDTFPERSVVLAITL